MFILVERSVLVSQVVRAKTNQQTVNGADTIVLKDNIQDFVVIILPYIYIMFIT